MTLLLLFALHFVCYPMF